MAKCSAISVSITDRLQGSGYSCSVCRCKIHISRMLGMSFYQFRKPVPLRRSSSASNVVIPQMLTITPPETYWLVRCPRRGALCLLVRQDLPRYLSKRDLLAKNRSLLFPVFLSLNHQMLMNINVVSICG